MKKFRRILALALLLAISLFTLAIAEEKAEILIDSSRNAALKFKGQDKADGVSGSFNVGGEIAKGLVAGSLDMKLNPQQAKELGDAQGAFYYTMTSLMEVVGNMDIPVPPDASKDLSKLDINVTSVMTTKSAYANGKFDIEARGNEEVPAMKFDVTAKSDSQKFDGRLGFDVDSEKMGPIPMKALQFSISEKDGSTTLDLGVSVDVGSPYAANLKQMGQNPDMIKQGITQQLGQAGIQVESVTVGEYKEENGSASAKLTIVMKEWRNLVKSGVGMMAGGQYDAQKMTQAVGKMLDAKFEKVVFKYDLQGKAVKGEFSGTIDNFSSFLIGYYELTALITDAQLKNQGDSDDPGKRFMLAYQSVAMDEAKIAMQTMIDAKMGFDLKGKANIASQGEDKKGVKVDGDFTSDITNYKAYVDKAKATGLPAAENAAFKMDVALAEGARIKGTLYAYTDASFVNYYKSMVIKTAKKAGAPAEAIAEAEKVDFKESAGSVTISKDGIQGKNYLQASDLTPIAKLALNAGFGQDIGSLTGFSIQGKTEGEMMNVDGTVNFSKFMEGKSADAVKQMMGPKTTVKEGASAEEVKLVAVTKPEVTMPSALTAVAADGKKLLSSSPVAALGGGKGGNNNLLLILGGLAAVGVVGVGVAAGRKKS